MDKDKRIEELEQGMRYMKSLNSAMLKSIVDCSKMVLNCYATIMGQRDAEAEALKFTEKYQFGKEKEAEN
jgi:uncharacterized membrane protein